MLEARVDRRSAKLFSTMLTLAAFAAAPAAAKAIAGPRASGELRPAANSTTAGPRAVQTAQNIYPYPGGGYYYPPGYDPRQPSSDGWGYTGRGWGDRYSGGWGGSNMGGGSGWGGSPNGWGAAGGYNYPPPQGGRGNRW